MKDIGGHALPLKVTQGQFKWAVRGVTNGKIVLIGRTEMVSRTQQVSSSYSCPMDCGPTYEVEIDPAPSTVFVGHSEATTAQETASWNYGYMMGPYPATGGWSLDAPIAIVDPSVASSVTVTGTSVGSTTIITTIGWQQRYDWDGLNRVDVGSYLEQAREQIDVPSPEIALTKARLYELNAPFSFNVATLNAGSGLHGDEICGNNPQQFIVTVHFQLPPGGELVPSRCSARPESIPDQNYNVGDVNCVMDGGSTGHMSIEARRRCCGGPDNYPGIRFTIGANKSGQSGTIDTPGTVRILCNQ